MTNTRIGYLVMILSAAVACSAAPAPSTTPTGPAMAMHHHGAASSATCPMKIPGATAAVADTSDGVAITFTTSGDVAELRSRVHRLAEQPDAAQDCCTMMAQGEAMMPQKQGMMVPSTAAAEDVEAGVRLALAPRDPAQLATLRERVRMHAAMMEKGQCPMMAANGHGPAK